MKPVVLASICTLFGIGVGYVLFGKSSIESQENMGIKYSSGAKAQNNHIATEDNSNIKPTKVIGKEGIHPSIEKHPHSDHHQENSDHLATSDEHNERHTHEICEPGYAAHNCTLADHIINNPSEIETFVFDTENNSVKPDAVHTILTSENLDELVEAYSSKPENVLKTEELHSDIINLTSSLGGYMESEIACSEVLCVSTFSYSDPKLWSQFQNEFFDDQHYNIGNIISLASSPESGVNEEKMIFFFGEDMSISLDN